MRIWTFVSFLTLAAGLCRAEMPLEKTVAPVRSIVLQQIEGRLDHLAIDPKSNQMYVAALGSGRLVVIDLEKNRMFSSVVGLTKPQGVAVAVDLDRLMVANELNGACRILEIKTMREMNGINLGSDADNVRYDAAVKKFWVGYGSGALVTIDPMTAEKGKEIALGGHPESFQLEARGKRIFVNVPVAGYIAVVDREKGTVLEKWKPKAAAGFFPMALDEEHHRLLVGCRKPATFLVLDTETGKTIMSAECAPDCDDLHYDVEGKQVYISGDGYVSVFRRKSADAYELTANVVTGEGARTSLFDPASGLLYVAVPRRQSQRAEVRVYDLRAKP